MNMRRRVGNGVDVRGRVRNRVQVIAMSLVVNVRLRVGNVVDVRLRMQMRLLIRRSVRLIRLGVSLVNAVSVNDTSLLRIHLTLDHRTSRTVLLLIRLRHGRIAVVRRNLIEMRGGVRNAVDVRRCMRHGIDMVAMLDIVGVCRRVRHIVLMRGRVGHDPLGLSGGG